MDGQVCTGLHADWLDSVDSLKVIGIHTWQLRASIKRPNLKLQRLFWPGLVSESFGEMTH